MNYRAEIEASRIKAESAWIDAIAETERIDPIIKPRQGTGPLECSTRKI